MKKRVLQGVNLVFSGIVALGAQPEDSEYWKAATLFGAKCASDLNTKTTHVLANQVEPPPPPFFVPELEKEDH